MAGSFFPSIGGRPSTPAVPATKDLAVPERKDAATRRASSGRGQGWVQKGQPYTPPGFNIDRLVKDGYEKVIWAFRGIDAIADKMSGWPILCEEGWGEDAKQVTDEPALMLLNQYSNVLERQAKYFRYRLVSQLLLSKKGVFVEVLSTNAGDLSALNLLPPGLTSPIPDPDTFISGFRLELPYGIESKPHIDLPAYDPKTRRGVLWIRKPHPTDPYSSVTPLESAGISLDLDFYARLYNRNFLLNDGRAGQIVAVKGNLSPEDAAELKARFTPGLAGAGRTSVVEADSINVADTAVTPRDAQYAELRNITKDDLLIALGTPESVLGNASGRTFDNADAEKENWLDVTVVPLSQVVDGGFDPLTEGGWEDNRRFRHDTSGEPVLRRAKEKRIAQARVDAAAGLITYDEYRDIAELEKMDRPATRVLWIPAAGRVAVGDEGDEAAAGALKPLAGGPAGGAGAAGGEPGGDPFGNLSGFNTQVDQILAGSGAVGTPQAQPQALALPGPAGAKALEAGEESSPFGGDVSVVEGVVLESKDDLELEAKKYNPNQPRYPNGHPQGGQFMDTGDVARWLAGKPLKDGTPSTGVVDPNTGSTDSPAATAGGAGGAARFLNHSDPKVRAAAEVLTYPAGYKYARVLGAPAAKALTSPKATKTVSLRKGDVVQYGGSKDAPAGDYTIASTKRVGTGPKKGKHELELVNGDGDTVTVWALPDQPAYAVARTPHPQVVAAAKREVAAAAVALAASGGRVPGAAVPPPRATPTPAAAPSGPKGPFTSAMIAPGAVFTNNKPMRVGGSVVMPVGSTMTIASTGQGHLLEPDGTKRGVVSAGWVSAVLTGNSSGSSWNMQKQGTPVAAAPAPAAAAAPAQAGVPHFNLPAPMPGSAIYAHPSGKHIYVSPTGGVSVWKPDGKKGTTSATAAKLAAGYGQWRQVTAPATGPIPQKGTPTPAPAAAAGAAPASFLGVAPSSLTPPITHAEAQALASGPTQRTLIPTPPPPGSVYIGSSGTVFVIAADGSSVSFGNLSGFNTQVRDAAATTALLSGGYAFHYPSPAAVRTAATQVNVATPSVPPATPNMTAPDVVPPSYVTLNAATLSPPITPVQAIAMYNSGSPAIVVPVPGEAYASGRSVVVVAGDGSSAEWAAGANLPTIRDAGQTLQLFSGQQVESLGTPKQAIASAPSTAAAQAQARRAARAAAAPPPAAPSPAVTSRSTLTAAAANAYQQAVDMLTPPANYPYPVVKGAPVATALKAPKPIKAASLRKGDVIQFSGAPATVVSVDRSTGTVTALDPYGGTVIVPAPSGNHLALARTPHPTQVAAARRTVAKGAPSNSAPAPTPAAPTPAAPTPAGIAVGAPMQSQQWTVQNIPPGQRPPAGTYPTGIAGGGQTLNVNPDGTGYLSTNPNHVYQLPALVAAMAANGGGWTPVHSKAGPFAAADVVPGAVFVSIDDKGVVDEGTRVEIQPDGSALVMRPGQPPATLQSSMTRALTDPTEGAYFHQIAVGQGTPAAPTQKPPTVPAVPVGAGAAAAASNYGTADPGGYTPIPGQTYASPSGGLIWVDDDGDGWANVVGQKPIAFTAATIAAALAPGTGFVPVGAQPVTAKFSVKVGRWVNVGGGWVDVHPDGTSTYNPGGSAPSVSYDDVRTNQITNMSIYSFSGPSPAGFSAPAAPVSPAGAPVAIAAGPFTTTHLQPGRVYRLRSTGATLEMLPNGEGQVRDPQGNTAGAPISLAAVHSVLTSTTTGGDWDYIATGGGWQPSYAYAPATPATPAAQTTPAAGSSSAATFVGQTAPSIGWISAGQVVPGAVFTSPDGKQTISVGPRGGGKLVGGPSGRPRNMSAASLQAFLRNTGRRWTLTTAGANAPAPGQHNAAAGYPATPTRTRPAPANLPPPGTPLQGTPPPNTTYPAAAAGQATTVSVSTLARGQTVHVDGDDWIVTEVLSAPGGTTEVWGYRPGKDDPNTIVQDATTRKWHQGSVIPNLGDRGSNIATLVGPTPVPANDVPTGGKPRSYEATLGAAAQTRVGTFTVNTQLVDADKLKPGDVIVLNTRENEGTFVVTALTKDAQGRDSVQGYAATTADAADRLSPGSGDRTPGHLFLTNPQGTMRQVRVQVDGAIPTPPVVPRPRPPRGASSIDRVDISDAASQAQVRDIMSGPPPALAQLPSITRIGDRKMGHLMELRGYNGHPDVITDAEMDDYVKAGEIELWRGMSGQASQVAGDYRSGPHYPGGTNGTMYGTGTYAAYGHKAGEDAIDFAKGYAGHGSGVMVRMTIKADARVAEYDTLYAEMRSSRDPIVRKFAALGTAGVGHYAVYMGYDVIRKSNAYNSSNGVRSKDDWGYGFVVIVNRSAVRISETDYTGHQRTATSKPMSSAKHVMDPRRAKHDEGVDYKVVLEP